MKSLYLSTPCYGGLCLEAFAMSIINLQTEILKHGGYRLMFDTIENESLVHRARNVSVGRYMQKTKADFFMFIDADIHFDPRGVIRLLEADRDISVSVYPKKCIMWDQIKDVCKKDNDINPAMLPLKGASLVMNIGREKQKVEPDGFIKVLDGPTGFMVIKRHVFEKLEEKFPELDCVNDHQNRDFDKYHAVFDCMIDPESRRYLSEDYAFCRRWQQIGGEIHADCMGVLGHVGNLTFTGSLYDRIKAK